MSINELPLEVITIDDIVPIGVSMEWYSLILPSDRFVFVSGQEFDVTELTSLAIYYPDGVLPDPRWDFIRYVGIDEIANIHHAQSVQPLTFIGNALPEHNHQKTGVVTDHNRNGHNITAARHKSWSQSGGTTVHDVISGTASAGTPTGTIGGTGKETAPRYLTAYPIMRIK